MSYHRSPGLGQLSLRNISAVSTAQPVVQSAEPTPFMIQATSIQPQQTTARIATLQLPTAPIVVEPVVASPVDTGPTAHRAPAVPEVTPEFAVQATLNLPTLSTLNLPTVTNPATTPSTPIVSLTSQPSGAPVAQTVQLSLPGTQAPQTQAAAAETAAGQAAGAVTLEALAAACKQAGGKMGTNCCKLQNGTSFGVQAGKLVQVAECKTLNLPLIAGAAVVALLLARGL